MRGGTSCGQGWHASLRVGQAKGMDSALGLSNSEAGALPVAEPQRGQGVLEWSAGLPGAKRRPSRSREQAGPVALIPLGLQALSKHRAALRLSSASAQSAEALPGPERPTTRVWRSGRAARG